MPLLFLFTPFFIIYLKGQTWSSTVPEVTQPSFWGEFRCFKYALNSPFLDRINSGLVFVRECSFSSCRSIHSFSETYDNTYLLFSAGCKFGCSNTFMFHIVFDTGSCYQYPCMLRCFVVSLLFKLLCKRWNWNLWLPSISTNIMYYLQVLFSLHLYHSDSVICVVVIFMYYFIGTPWPYRLFWFIT